MSGSEPPREIVDALVWDVPRLRAGSVEARQFLAAMTAEGWPSEEADEVQGRLGLAATAVAHERSQEPQEAAALYQTLGEDEEPWVRLLGLMLRSWSETESGPAAIEDSHELLASLDPPPDLKARLLVKLATYGFDEGAPELGRESLAEAIAFAPPGSQLKRALAIEGLNAGLPYEWSTEEPAPDSDPLVEYPWIESALQRAAQNTLAAQVEASGRGVWTHHFSFGRTPLDDALSADVQATWAGALWMRRPIRKQLGAQLLSGAAHTPPQWSFGVLMWALGGGPKPESAYALAEPMLESGSADFIVKTLAEVETSPRFSHRLISVAVEAWDEISEETLRAIVESQPIPSEDEHPTVAELRRLWAGYAARLTEEWLPRFEEFDSPTQVALLEMIGTRMLSDFPVEAKNAVYGATRRAIGEDRDIPAQLLMILGASALSGEVDEQMRAAIAEHAAPSAVARLAHAGHLELLTDDALAVARDSLLETVRGEVEKAREGTVSFGSEDARLNLGRIVASTGKGEENTEATAVLMAIATDAGMPSEHLLQARTALTLLRRAGLLSSDQLAAIREAADPAGSFPGYGNISPDLLRVSRLRVLAAAPTAEEVVAIVGYCRSREAKVRDLALATCLDAVGASRADREIEPLAWSLIGGLFDPSDEVIEHVAEGITTEFLRNFPAAGQVARDRFPQLLDFGRMGVRATVRLRACEWADDEEFSDGVTSELLERTAEDRSWIVRNV